MILRSIYLHVSELGVDAEYTYSFKKRSRFICNWLEREVLKKLKFESKGFDTIVVGLHSAVRPDAYVNTSKVACVDIKFDRKQIDSVLGDDLALLQIAMLKTGIEKCALAYSIPEAELLRGLDTFVSQGMKNEWLQKKRVFKEHRLTAALNCKMTQDTFTLMLTVERQNTLVLEEMILGTEPDEIVFDSKFKDVEIDHGNLVVTAKIGRPLWSRSLAKINQSLEKESGRQKKESGHGAWGR